MKKKSAAARLAATAKAYAKATAMYGRALAPVVVIAFVAWCVVMLICM